MTRSLLLIRNGELEAPDRLSHEGVLQMRGLAATLHEIARIPDEVCTGYSSQPFVSVLELAQEFALSAHGVAISRCSSFDAEQANRHETVPFLADLVSAGRSRAPATVLTSHYFILKATARMGQAVSLDHGEALLVPLAEDGHSFDLARADRIRSNGQILPLSPIQVAPR